MKKIISAFLINLIISLPVYSEKQVTVIPFDSSNDIKDISYGISDNISQSLVFSEDIYVINRGQLMSALKEKKLSVDLSKLNYVSSFFDTDLTIKGKLSKIQNNNYQNSEIYNLNLDLYDSKNGKLINKLNIKANNIFSLQDKAVKEIIKSQNIYNTEEQWKIINSFNYLTSDIKAYKLYTTSKNYSYIMTENSIKESIDYLDKAIKTDPKFLVAKADKAELMSILLLYSYFNGNLKIDEINKLSEFINKNLLNTNFNQVYKAKSVLYFLTKNYKEGLVEAQKSYELSKGDAYSNYLIWLNESKDNSLLDKALTYNSYFLPALISKSNIEKNNENYEAAANILNKINSFTPKQQMIDLLLADIYFSQNKDDKALKEYEAILDKDPFNYKANLGLGRIYQNKDENEKAINYYNKALKINPNSSEAHFYTALIKHSEGKADEAIDEYNYSISIEPQNAKYYSGLGQLYFQLGKFQEAETQYKKSIEINPDMAYAYVNLGLVYNKLSRKDEAIDYIKQAINIKPDYSYAFYNLGIIYQENNENNSALENYKKALIIDNKNSLAYNKIGEIYVLSNNDKEAINNFSKAIELEPNFTLAYINLAKLQVSQKKYKDGISAFKTALKLKPKNKPLRLEASKAYFDYGVELFNKKNFNESIKQFSESIKLKPDNDIPYIYLGKSYFNLSNYKNALSEFKKAQFIKNDNPETLYNLGLVYAKMNMNKESSVFFKKACDLGDNNYCSK